MRTAGEGRARHRARRHQRRIELLVGEMTHELYPAVTSDDDVRGRGPGIESGAQAAVVEYDGHGDPELLTVGADGLDGVGTSRDTGAPLFFTMNTMIFAGAVLLALAETRCTSVGSS
jgi:hypothetical protein